MSLLEQKSDLLKTHGLKITETRLKVLGEFYERDYALSHQDVETALSDLDRVTLYRTLNSFESKGITHKVLGQNGVAKYALCKHQCDEHGHHDNHFHFHCTNCEKTYCLDESLKQEIKLPRGFVMNDVRLNVRGVCLDCG